jgi:hypothetical protein
MEVSKILTLLILGIFLFSLVEIGVNAKYVTSYCLCNCKGETIPAKGYAKSYDKAEKRCNDTCGRACGSRTDCEDGCESCCDKWCQGIQDQAKSGCGESCKHTCEFKKLVKGIIDIIYAAAGIVAAIMFVIHGLRLISSQDPSERDEAKKAIFFVIFALVVIGLGSLIVGEFAKRIIMPKPQIIPTVEGCGGYLFADEVTHQISGDEIRIKIPFVNNGKKACEFYVDLYDAKGDKVTTSSLQNVQPGEIRTIIIDSGHALWRVHRLKGAYTVKLYRQEDYTVKLIGEKTNDLGSDYKCSGKLDVWHEIKENKMNIHVTYSNPSTKLTCEYRVYLYDIFGGYILKEPDMHYNDVLPGESYSLTITPSINRVKAGYKVVLWEEQNQKVDEFTKDLRTEKLKEKIKEIGDAVINCWRNCKEVNNKDAKCYEINVGDLGDNDEIDERMVRGYIKDEREDKGAEKALKWYVSDPLTKDAKRICVKYEVRIARTNLKYIYILKSDDPGCNRKPMSEVCKVEPSVSIDISPLEIPRASGGKININIVASNVKELKPDISNVYWAVFTQWCKPSKECENREQILEGNTNSEGKAQTKIELTTEKLKDIPVDSILKVEVMTREILEINPDGTFRLRAWPLEKKDEDVKIV